MTANLKQLFDCDITRDCDVLKLLSVGTYMLVL